MLYELALIGLAFALGGILKGATGAGAAIIAIPVLAAVYDVQTAVTVFVLPAIFLNIGQVVAYWRHRLSRTLLLRFVGTACVGVLLGTVMLKTLPGEVLGLVVAVMLTLYILFRFYRPHWQLARQTGEGIAAPTGLATGLLQGSAGISAPVSITYLNAMRLDRSEFIANISIIYTATGLVQLPAMLGLGLMTIERFLMSVAGLALMLALMPIGSRLAKRLPLEVFDRIILGLLALIAVRLIYNAAIVFWPFG